jgi:cytochrome c-type biogenesis protein
MQVNLFTSFAAGLVSFISPCVLPLVPVYLSLLTGSTLDDLRDEARNVRSRARVLIHAFAFVCGFTVIFVLLGLSASAIGTFLGTYRDWIARIGGVIIIILGLHMMGVFRIPWLMMDKRVHVRTNQTYAASFLVGIGFAAGWSPCIGPILSGILLLASQEKHVTQAALDLLAYSAGLAVPFLLVAIALGWALNALNRIKRLLPKIEFGAGLVMIAAGIIVASDSFLRISGWLYQYVPTPKL